MKSKCQRCRLIKCFQSGMRKDHLSTPEEKLSKQKRIEENRSIRLTKVNHENTSSILTDIDQFCLLQISNAYQTSIESIPSASSVISFDLLANKALSFTTVTEIDKISAMKLINFIRLIPEFESLNEEDRITLVKSNLVTLLIVRDLLLFDRQHQIVYDDNIHMTKQSEREKFAQCVKSLCILFYGYEEMQIYFSCLSNIIDIFDKDPLIIQLLLIILLFERGLSINNEQISILFDGKRIFDVYSQYVELLFRYLIHRSSFTKAICKMLHIVESIFQIHNHAQRYQQLFQSKNDYYFIDPLLKSLFQIK
ncbi:unnamed protein product [Adineta ricciae]|nr:unnamed protein product [Adineta ricciae]